MTVKYKISMKDGRRSSYLKSKDALIESIKWCGNGNTIWMNPNEIGFICDSGKASQMLENGIQLYIYDVSVPYNFNCVGNIIKYKEYDALPSKKVSCTINDEGKSIELEILLRTFKGRKVEVSINDIGELK